MRTIQVSDEVYKKLLAIAEDPEAAISKLVYHNFTVDDKLDEAVTLGFLTTRTANALGKPYGAGFTTIREAFEFEDEGNDLQRLRGFGFQGQRQMNRLRHFLHYPMRMGKRRVTK